MKFLTAITSVGILIYLVSATSEVPVDEYNKQIKNLNNLVAAEEKLKNQYTDIYRIFNNTHNNNSNELREICSEYETSRKEYIHNVTEINKFIEQYGLSDLKPSLKNHAFLDVNKLEQSLTRTISICNVTVRKKRLFEDLDNMRRKNKEANDVSNSKNSTIKLSDIKNIAIPNKKNILCQIEKHIEEVISIKKYCKNQISEDSICGTETLEISYWEALRNNITDDLSKLENQVTVHIIVNYVQPIIYILVFLFGFVGNTIILTIFFQNKKFRKPQNMIIFNLTVADTLTLIINMPLNHAFEKIGRGDVVSLSQFFNFSRYLCLGLSTFSAVALCLQRFSVTLKASSYIGFILRQSTRDSARKVIIVIWIVATIFASPRGIHGDIYIYETYNIRKTMYDLPVQIVTTVELLVLSVIPFIIISVLSWLTVRHFQDRARRIPADIPKLHKSYQLDVLSRSTKIIMINPLVFACTSLPFFLFYSLRNFFKLDGNSIPDTTLKIAATSLLFLGCSFNPIGLYVASGNFRRHMREMFGLGPRKKSLKYKRPQQVNCSQSENETLDTYL